MPKPIYPTERVKLATGVAVANCQTCRRISMEDDGGDPPGRSFPYCNTMPQYAVLKSFPFKKEMQCWRPHFWHSAFSENIDGLDDIKERVKQFNEAVESAEKEPPINE